MKVCTVNFCRENSQLIQVQIVSHTLKNCSKPYFIDDQFDILSNDSITFRLCTVVTFSTQKPMIFTN